MAKITYEDKELVQVNPLPEINKFTADNANEIKSVINDIDDQKANIQYVKDSGESITRYSFKTAHGFAVNDILTLDAGGVFVKMTDPVNDVFAGIVRTVSDADNFTTILGGCYNNPLADFNPGSTYYGTAAGGLSTTVLGPPILKAVTATVSIILNPNNAGGGGEWTFADNGGNFPVTKRGGVIYAAVDSWGTNGEDGYIAPDTWFMSKTGGGSTRDDYRANI